MYVAMESREHWDWERTDPLAVSKDLNTINRWVEKHVINSVTSWVGETVVVNRYVDHRGGFHLSWQHRNVAYEVYIDEVEDLDDNVLSVEI